MKRTMNNDFEKIEETLVDIKREAGNFRWKKDTVSSAVEILRDRRQTTFLCRKIWPSLVIFLLVCNLTQGFLLIRGRKKLLQSESSDKASVFVLSPGECPVNEIFPVMPQKHSGPETIVITSQNQEPAITAQEGLNKLLELYKLFETLSPAITLQKGGGSYGEI